MFNEVVIKALIEHFSTKNEPNFWGEVLRDFSFDQTEGLGCYSSFDMRPDFRSAKEELSLFIRTLLCGCFAKEEDDIARIEHYKHKDLPIDVYWFWDGDGTLLFKVEDIYLVNNDCKKDYVWEFVKQEDYEEVLNDSNYYNLETLWK